MWSFPLFPDQASTLASKVDALYFFLIAISIFFSILIAVLVVGLAIKYRRRSDDEKPPAIHGSLLLELTWTLIPAGIVLVIFVWSAEVYFSAVRVPKNAIEVQAVGKRWMWKIQHMTGKREINELHVPVGVPVKVTLTSEDVIHSFFIPAFRVKKDAVPGRYNTMWFEATRTGKYHLFCAEYCGTKHSGMIGTVYVMEPDAYQAWLGGEQAGASLAGAGEKLFTDLACITCHRGDSGARGPDLAGLFGKPVKLASGETVTADETYLRESIVQPAAKIVEGYQPIMPTFQGLLSEEQLLQLVAYIQGMKAEVKDEAAAPAAGAAAPSTGAR
ncbi:MAG: cytochrome c oxidase subunit II [Vicinamibacteria bacterium]|nr:cytochrome c oxidase subunit II [Vicinamibacteria bacterium]